ncbi:MAG: iron-containing alcohol dehydrogenase [Caldisericia bacterium]|nr:iron-containing alcohol dehydrogenase [Caldisericia bacterium]
MKRFMYFNPTKVYFGKGVIDSLGRTISESAQKVLLVYGENSIRKNGLLETIKNELNRSNIKIIEYSGIKTNPTLESVNVAIAIAKNNEVDAVLAVGGGSVIDTSKAIAAGYFTHGDVWDLFHDSKKIKNALPIYTVLTISGTASEMNGTAVISNMQTKEKAAIKSILLFPKATWIDPFYQTTVSSEQLSFTAVDIISHVFEYYFAGYRDTRFVDFVSEGIVKTVMESTEVLQKNPEDEKARANFAWAASWALNGFTSAGRGIGDFSSHRIGHAISAMYDIPHGQTLAIVQPAWMRYCYKNDIEKFTRFGKEIFHLNGNKDIVASEAISFFKNWINESLNLKTSLVDLGIRIDDIPKIASNPSIHYPLGALRALTENDVIHILRISNY